MINTTTNKVVCCKQRGIIDNDMLYGDIQQQALCPASALISRARVSVSNSIPPNPVGLNFCTNSGPVVLLLDERFSLNPHRRVPIAIMVPCWCHVLLGLGVPASLTQMRKASQGKVNRQGRSPRGQWGTCII